jgi:hypothetical protein
MMPEEPFILHVGSWACAVLLFCAPMVITSLAQTSSCSIGLTPASASLPATGTSTAEVCPNNSGQPNCGVAPETPVTFTVTPSAACGAWTATSSNPGFLQITSEASGSSVGTVAFAVLNNTLTLPQTYTITVASGAASAIYTVTEAGSGDSQVYREVYALYEQLLGRDPDPAGFAFWSGSGGAGLGQMADSFLSSPEAFNSDFAVMAAYQAATDDPPTYAQFTAAVTSVRAGTQTVLGLFNALIGSSFTVTNLYQNLLNRAPAAPDSSCINAGLGACFETIIGFPSNTTPVGATNNEFQSTGTYHTTVAADHTNGLYVQMIYYVTLSRDPDAAGLAFWTGVANTGGPGLLFEGSAGYGTRIQILGPGTPNQGFIGSPEFQGLFTAPGSTLPGITSITPSYGSIGQTLTGVVIQGSNLSGATFNLQGGGTATVVSSSSTEATVNIVVGSTPGAYTLLATGSGGTSSSTPTASNTFEVYYAPGNNHATLLFSVFNAAGTTPNYPAGSNGASLLFSVFNATGATPNYPAGSDGAALLFSVFNATGTTPSYPAGSNEAAQLFSVFNPLVTPGTTTLIPPGSNWAFQLFSTQNQTGASTAPLTMSLAPLAERIDFGAAGPGATAGRANAASHSLTMFAGQTVTITIQPSLFMTYLEIDADGAALASSAASPLSDPFTAPFGVASVDLTAFGYTNLGTTSAAPDQTVQVSSDPGRVIRGRVVDASGTPVAGARVTWSAQGLAAEYYRFDHELSAIPDLAGTRPERLSFLGALNYPNPHQIFGPDPMGVGMGKNYAARFRGKIQVETAGVYQFLLRAHAGARLKIDGELVAEAVALEVDSADAAGIANLTAGAHDIEVVHFESGGSAGLQLLWTPPGGVRQIVPPSIVSADAPAVWRAVTGREGRFVLKAPAALDGVVVKLVTGTGSIEVDR